jgi:hypothetical protein
MKGRGYFISFAAAIALVVGTLALVFPAELLASKGTVPSVTANWWMREVGVLLLCIGFLNLRVRNDPDSATLKTLMFGNLLVQLGLLITELVAYQQGVITLLMGILPNGILHLGLSFGFAYYWSKIAVTR